MGFFRKWSSIEGLDADASSLSDGELVALKHVWLDQKQYLEESGLLGEFSSRLHREWSIETGIIEGAYTLDRGVTRILIERGIDPSLISHDSTDRDPVAVARWVQDHYDVLEMLGDFVGGVREMTVAYIKEIHAALLRNVDTYQVVDQFGNLFEKALSKGVFKAEPNSPTRSDGLVHEYCPPEHVASEMDRLVELHHTHEQQQLPVEVRAAWLHHAFTQIHPFEDGNGRVARALAALVFVKDQWFPPVVTREERTRYIDALELADRGSLGALVRLFVEEERTALLKTMAIFPAEGDQLPGDRDSSDAASAISAIREVLMAKGELSRPEWSRTQEVAASAHEILRQRLEALRTALMNEIATGARGIAFDKASHIVDPAAISSFAQRCGYLPDRSRFGFDFGLSMQAQSGRSIIAFSFHAAGPTYRGMIAAASFFVGPSGQPVPLTDSVFQFNYVEDSGHALERFGVWLEGAIVKGLDLWRKSLV